MDAVEQHAEEEAKAGRMFGCGGLGPTALGARVRLSEGKVIVTDGPFPETKEVIGGYAQFELKSKEEAVETAGPLLGNSKKKQARLGGGSRGSPEVWRAEHCPPGAPRVKHEHFVILFG